MAGTPGNKTSSFYKSYPMSFTKYCLDVKSSDLNFEQSSINSMSFKDAVMVNMTANAS